MRGDIAKNVIWCYVIISNIKEDRECMVKYCDCESSLQHTGNRERHITHLFHT